MMDIQEVLLLVLVRIPKREIKSIAFCLIWNPETPHEAFPRITATKDINSIC